MSDDTEREYQEQIAYLQRDLAMAKVEIEKRDMLLARELGHHRNKTKTAGEMITELRKALDTSRKHLNGLRELIVDERCLSELDDDEKAKLQELDFILTLSESLLFKPRHH